MFRRIGKEFREIVSHVATGRDRALPRVSHPQRPIGNKNTTRLHKTALPSPFRVVPRHTYLGSVKSELGTTPSSTAVRSSYDVVCVCVCGGGHGRLRANMSVR